MKCKRCEGALPTGAIFCPWCGYKDSDKTKRPRMRSNGEGTVYQLPNRKWRAEINVFSGGKRYRRTKSGFLRKKDALAYLELLKANPMEQAKKLTVQAIYDMWEASETYNKLSMSKITHYKTAWSRVDDVKLVNFQQLSLSAMQQCVDNCPGGYYPKRDIKALFGHLYAIGIKNEFVDRDRSKFLDLPELPKSKKDAFRSPEIKKLWEDYESGHRFTAYILIMIYTGMRTGELYSIEIPNVHLDEHYMIGGIKSDAGINRVIPFVSFIEPVVADVLPDAKYGLANLRIEDFYDQYADLITRTGIRPLNPHCCRHTAATALAEAGVAPAIIKEILGHANYSTTLGYTHISIEDKVKAINSLQKSE